MFVFFRKTCDDVRNAQLYRRHVNSGDKSVCHALAAGMCHAFELTQDDDVACCLDFRTGIHIAHNYNAAVEFDLLTVAQRASVEFGQVECADVFFQQFRDLLQFVVSVLTNVMRMVVRSAMI